MAKTVYKGVIKTWKDDRGFGFIQPETGDKDIFVHISAFQDAPRRPLRGDAVHYQLGQDQSGKFKAVNARIADVEILENGRKAIKWWVWAAGGILLLAAAAAGVYFL